MEFSWPSFGPKKYRLLKRISWFVFFLIIVVAIFSYFTNPFVRFSLVRDPFASARVENGQIRLSEDETITLRTGVLVRTMAKLKSGWHIVGSRFGGGPKAQSNTVDEIIKEIHQVRFDPSEPYLISGDHFSVLYPRSLGIFYHSVLDDRTALDAQDWQNRQVIYLKTLAYASSVYVQSDSLSTTIVPIGPGSVALMNIYAVPSDTMYSLLFAYQQLIDNSYQRENYPFKSEVSYALETTDAAKDLLELHKEGLTKHYHQYFDYVYDQESGLVKKDLLLSGTKDVMKRSGAFYDNVILWKTIQLAQQLNLIEKDEQFLADLKSRILQKYWLEEQGIFVEDLSDQALAEKWYSSDWLIAFQTGFLNPSIETDKLYLTKSVEYIRRNAIDKPFALQYHPDTRNKHLYGLVRWFSPEYAATAIWSNWGMEYTKLLIRLAEISDDSRYLNEAENHLNTYAYNIKRYQGYPEVYDQRGDFYRTPLYKSIRRTGWVVTYEQAREMFEAVSRGTNN